MEGSVKDLGAPPDSWEVADLEASVSRLMLSSKDSYSSTNPPSLSSAAQELADSSSSSSSTTIGAQKVGAVSEDVVNSVDQFLCEALQNPRERLSVLRIEQDIVKFIRDATQQQMEFQQLPTSYLRLAAHRVAQHYSLQSMVLLDNSLPDGSGSRIVIRKTSESRIPSIRLADIPVNLPIGDSGGIKVAIKQRPQKGSPTFDSANSHSTKTNNSRSVEERKEEYNRARARIFNSSSFGGGAGGRTEIEPRMPDSFQNNSLGLSKAENNYVPVGFDVNNVRGSSDSSTNTSRLARSRIEQEQFSRSRSSNRVAIFRDREVERKDPDYDRSYDRYMQRFDPGFRFNGPYTVQPMYSPAVNYNTEFPQLGSAHLSSISTEQQPLPHPQHLPGSFPAPSTPAGIGYGHPDAMMSPFSPNHVGARSTPALYFHSVQYPCQHPGMPFIHPHEQVHHPFSQSHQQQLDASFGLARPR